MLSEGEDGCSHSCMYWTRSPFFRLPHPLTYIRYIACIDPRPSGGQNRGNGKLFLFTSQGLLICHCPIACSKCFHSGQWHFQGLFVLSLFPKRSSALPGYCCICHMLNSIAYINKRDYAPYFPPQKNSIQKVANFQHSHQNHSTILATRCQWSTCF